MFDYLYWYWKKIQRFLDVEGDAIMFFFTMAVVYKVVHGGMTGPDAAAYASAIGCFAYSNKGGK